MVLTSEGPLGPHQRPSLPSQGHFDVPPHPRINGGRDEIPSSTLPFVTVLPLKTYDKKIWDPSESRVVLSESTDVSGEVTVSGENPGFVSLLGDLLLPGVLLLLVAPGALGFPGTGS